MSSTLHVFRARRHARRPDRSDGLRASDASILRRAALGRDGFHRAARGRVPHAPLRRGQGALLGARRPQPGQAGEGARRARGRRPPRARAGPPRRRRGGPRFARPAGGGRTGGVLDGGAVRAARKGAGGGVRRGRHRLLRPHRGAAVRAGDDRRASRACADHRRAHRALLRIRLHPVGPGDAYAPGARARHARRALRRGEAPRRRVPGRHERRHRREHGRGDGRRSRATPVCGG